MDTNQFSCAPKFAIPRAFHLKPYENFGLKIAPLQLKMLADKGRSTEGLEEEVDGVTVSLQVDIRSKKSAWLFRRPSYPPVRFRAR